MWEIWLQFAGIEKEDWEERSSSVAWRFDGFSLPPPPPQAFFEAIGKTAHLFFPRKILGFLEHVEIDTKHSPVFNLNLAF